MRTIVIGIAAILATLVAGSSSYAASSCYPPEVARNAVKLLLAFGNAPAIKQVCGAAFEDGDAVTVVTVLPQYQGAVEDSYVVRVRNEDCRVLSIILVAEKRASSDCSH